MDPLILLALFFAFQFKHYLADFPLQNYYVILGKMLDKKADVALSLAVHGIIHGIFTTAIFIAAGVMLDKGLLIFWPVMLGLLDAVIHGSVDALVLYLGRETRYTVTNNMFASVFGFDQFLHHSTYVLLVAIFFNVVLV